MTRLKLIGSLTEGSPWSLVYVSEQRGFWRDRAEAVQGRLNLAVRICNNGSFPATRLKLICSLAEDSPWSAIYVSEQRGFWRVCAMHRVAWTLLFACFPATRLKLIGSLAEGSPWSAIYVSEQRGFWRVCADAQARLNLLVRICNYIYTWYIYIHIPVGSMAYILFYSLYMNIIHITRFIITPFWI